MSGGTIGIQWSDADSARVSILTESGASSTGFKVNGSAVTFPYTLTRGTRFVTTSDGSFTVSVKLNGQEIADTPDGTRTIHLENDVQVVFAPSADTPRPPTPDRLYHIDSYNDFFAGGKWITSQSNTATTLTGAVAAGASVLPVASATGIVANQQLVVGAGGAQQKIYTVASVAGSNVTINGTTAYALANGSAVTPLWTNSTHLTTVGYQAFAYFIANALDTNGDYVIRGAAPKVTVLGNSWISQGLTIWASEITDRIPSATVINAGFAGDNSAALLARFDTDVPATSNYVVFNEPGVNDDTAYATPTTQEANLQELVRKIRAIGAIPIYTGHVPLADVATYAAARQAQADSIIGDGVAYPGAAVAGTLLPKYPDADSIGLGTGALVKVTTGVQNTVLGVRAGQLITTGGQNALVGREAGAAITTGLNNTGIGQNALRAAVTASNNTAVGEAALATTTAASNTAVGQNALVLASSGASNTAVGASAGYSPAGDAAKATTTASSQTFVGYRAGADSTSSFTCAFGSDTVASGYGSTAISAGAVASALGSVAIGRDSAGTAASSAVQDKFTLGTTLHTVTIPGRLNVATRTPSGSADSQGTTGDYAWDDSYVYVKTSAGWKRSALSTF